MDVPGFEGAKYVFTPPLREKWNQEKLWQGLARDTLQVVSTTIARFCFKEQRRWARNDFTKIPNGGPGVEHRLSLIYSGGVHGGSFRRTVSCSSSPRLPRNFSAVPAQRNDCGSSDADLVIFDPNSEQVISAKTHHMRVTTPCSREFA